jgi:hypothetical protein
MVSMLDFPVKLLIIGYGLAALAAALIGSAHGLAAAVLSFWLGGPFLVVLLAATPGLNRPFLLRREAVTDAEERALAEQLRRWEADRLSESVDASGLRGERRG